LIWSHQSRPKEIALADRRRLLTQIASGDLDIAGIGQLPATQLVLQSVRQVPPLPSRVRIGDFVQTPTVTANQVAAGRRVVWLADGERYLYVEKSLARYPVQAITRIEAPTGPPDGLR